MAKPKMITRLIEATTATAQVVIKSKGELTKVTTVVSGSFSNVNDPSLTKLVKKAIENDDTMLVKITNITDSSDMYGMPEEDFIAHAKKLDPITRKVIDAPETPTTSEPEATTEPEAPTTTEPTTKTKLKKGAK